MCPADRHRIGGATSQALWTVRVYVWCVCVYAPVFGALGGPGHQSPVSTTGVRGAYQHLCWQLLEGRDCAPLISESPRGTKEVLSTWWVEIKWC